ncbi:MAG: hypothetical protein ABSF80_06380 [Chitinispirillaceae bacterium]|jgi:hypothetical protein
MKKKGIQWLLLAIAPSFMLPFSVAGAPIYPYGEEGTVVCLFESGTAEIRDRIAINDTLTVYRQKSDSTFYKVGKIVVRSFAGDYYIQGVIVQGRLKEKDVAEKGTIACLVVSLGEPCNIR